MARISALSVDELNRRCKNIKMRNFSNRNSWLIFYFGVSFSSASAVRSFDLALSLFMCATFFFTTVSHAEEFTGRCVVASFSALGSFENFYAAVKILLRCNL